MANAVEAAASAAKQFLDQSVVATFGGLAAVPVATAIAALGASSYALYRSYLWYRHRSNEDVRARKLLQKVKSSPGELPVPRPISMGDEDTFRTLVRASRLNKELKSALCRDGVYVGRPEHVVSLLEKMTADGAEKFQVVSDFDATLTRYHRDGKRCDTCYGILDTNSRMPAWYREETDKLRKKYYAIELDPLLTTEEKIPHMKTWWTRAHELMKQANFQKSWLSKMVQESSVELRERTGVLFAILDHCNIPLLIYSAGISDLIKEVLFQRCSFRNFAQYPLIVANQMRFNETGWLVGFNEELIHTFNKNEIFPHHREYFDKHQNRSNVMLMGDMMGDLRMADGIQTKENVITIGFLNSKVQESFPIYRDSFDIVLIDDQTMDVPIAIAETVINGNTPFV